jgi:hypothetical protein
LTHFITSLVFPFKINEKEGKNKKKENKDEKTSQNIFDEFNQKFSKTMNFVESLKIPEIEIEKDNKSNNVKYISSTINLVNYLLSDECRDLVKSFEMNDINHLTNEKREVIQKRINEIIIDKKIKEKEERMKNNKVEEKEKKEVNQHQEFSVLKALGWGNNKLTINESIGEQTTTPNEEFFYQNKTKKTNTNKKRILNINLNKYSLHPLSQSSNTTNNNTYRLYSATSNKPKQIQNKEETQRNQSASPHKNQIKRNPFSFRENYNKAAEYSHRIKTEVPNYKYSYFVFSPQYKQKKRLMENLIEKELIFQKKILTLKKNEKQFINDFDQVKVEEECETFYKKVLSNKKKLYSNPNGGNRKEIINEEKMNKNKKKNDLQLRVIKSLNKEQYEKYGDFLKQTRKSSNFLRKEFLQIKDKTYSDRTQVNKTNNLCLQKIEEQLENINKYTDICIRELHTKKRIIKKEKRKEIEGKEEEELSHFIQLETSKDEE